jgi:hypothetical protein
MKPKNSSGYDGISTKILRLCGSQISKPLAFISDKSIKTGVFPERLKYAVTTPSHKKGDVSNMANYRTMSLLPLFSNIFEKVLHSRLNQHLQTNNILTTEQCAFRKGFLTEQATNSLTNNELMAWNKKIHIGRIFCDLTTAYDFVHHDILIAKFEHYRIQETTLNWFKYYLINGKQRTKTSINKNLTHYSTWKTVKQGVTNGSVLGPLHFIMYINDLPMSVTHDSKAVLFADDTSVFVTDKDYTSFKQKMNLALPSLDQRFTANQLVLNITKTNLIKFTLKTTVCSPGYFL